MTFTTHSRTLRAAALLLASALTATAALEHKIERIIGPTSAYRGYSVWFSLDMAWWNLFDITSINPATDTITVPGHTFVNGDIVRMFNDTGTLPAVMHPERNYVVCNVTPTTIQIAPLTCSIVLDFTDSGTGISKIGPELRLSTHQPGYLMNITGLPGMTMAQVSCGVADCIFSSGGYYGGFAAQRYWVRFDISPTATLGSGTISMMLRLSGFPDRTLTAPFTIKDLTPLAFTPPTTFPAIPNKTLWESSMLSTGAKWCAKSTGTTDPQSWGFEGGVWYYDGAWVYHQIADYTGDAEWRNCSNSLMSFYKDRIILTNGALQAWRTFTDGMKRSCSSCDGSLKAMLLRVAENMAYASTAGDTRDDLMRETSYLLEAQVNAARANGYRDFADLPTTGTYGQLRTRMRRAADQLLGQYDQIHANTFIYQQTFMIGLSMKALISYYEFSQDPRVPRELKTMLDYLWTRAWNPAINGYYYNVEPPLPGGTNSPRCEVNCYPFSNTELNNLVGPGNGWMWRFTGDDNYRTRGDLSFSNALNTDITYSGKIFSQNYRWSFDYVNWREGRARRMP